MKNSNLIKRLQAVKQDKSIEIIEGFVLSALKGGEGCNTKTKSGCTKCKPNSATGG